MSDLTGIRYSQATRRGYIQANRSRYEAQNFSYRDIAWDVKAAFSLENTPSPATIGQDLRYLDQRSMVREITEEAQRLLDPENFPEWRRLIFTAPGGEQYETPDHQIALFWMIVSLTFKQKPPDWVVRYFDLTDDEVSDIESMEKLLTFILLVAPRHGKTDLVIHTLIWLMCVNPNVRIIYCQGIAKTSVRIMKYIQWELEFNEELVKLYGPFRGDEHAWNTEEFTIATRTEANKSPTFFPIGINSNVRSLDADIIVVDDPQDTKRVKSEVVADNDFEHFTTEIMTRREKHTPVIGIGSHLPVMWGDLWSMLEDAQEDLNTEGQVIHVRDIPAHNDDICTGDHSDPAPRCVLWPTVRPHWFLMAQKAILDRVRPGMFDVVYNQKAKAAGLGYFNAEVLYAPYWVPSEEDKNDKGVYPAPMPIDDEVLGILDYSRSWKQWPTCCGTLVSAMGFDPAASEKKGGSESALSVRVACASCGRRFMVDYWHRQQSPERHPNTIGSYVRAYREDGLYRVRIEVNAYQKSLARDPRLMKLKRDLKLRIDEWTTDDKKWDPDLGVPNMAVWQNDGMLSVPAKTKADLAYAEAYLRAYKRYPSKPNDIVMADWLAELELEEAIRNLTDSVPDEMPGFEDMAEYLQDQVVEIDLSDVGADDSWVY